MLVAHTAIALIHRSGDLDTIISRQSNDVHANCEFIRSSGMRCIIISMRVHLASYGCWVFIADVLMLLIRLNCDRFENVSQCTPSLFASGKCARSISIVSLMALYRVGENADGRGNFDRTFPRRNWNCAWIIMNVERPVSRRDQQRSKASRVEIYLHIFHRAGVTRSIRSGVALFSSVIRVRYLERIGKINICSVREINILFTVFNLLFAFFFFFTFASETVKNTTCLENREL